jgi:hypothetical protein
LQFSRNGNDQVGVSHCALLVLGRLRHVERSAPRPAAS